MTDPAHSQFRVGVLGAGAWGSALACIAARAGHEVRVWARSKARADEINTQHTNRDYLGDLVLDQEIKASSDLEAVCRNSDYLLLAIPMQSLGALLPEIAEAAPEGAGYVCCSKGIDRVSGKFSSELVREQFPSARVGALSGPSFASDVIRGMPTAVTVASDDAGFCSDLAKLFSTGSFRCYASQDLTGVEIGGALKNVLALAVGAARGMELGASAEAALIARGFAEIQRLSLAMGAKPETLSGLSGLGDIVLSCSSEQSRNFKYGVAMGRNEPRDDLPLAEGAHTASVALEVARREGVDMPIVEAVVNVLQSRLTAKEAVAQLLMRPLKHEG